jgi:hypothetical protein
LTGSVSIAHLPSRLAFEGSPPQHLFHYTDLDGVRGILTSRTLWLSKFTSTNDISEILLAVEHFRAFVEQRAGDFTKAEGDFLKRASDDLGGFRRTNICIASFCEQDDLLSQWRSYGNDGRGISLGFNGAKLIALARANGLHLYRCVYDPAAHERIASDLVNMLLDSYRAAPPATPDEERAMIDEFSAAFLKVAPVIKDHRFAEEREWRLVSDAVTFDDPRMIAVVRGNQASVKWTLRLDGDEAGGSGAIEQVTIGPTLDPDNVSDAIEVLSRRNGFRVEKISISEVPYRRIPE